jgi:hypothetical protein
MGLLGLVLTHQRFHTQHLILLLLVALVVQALMEVAVALVDY